MARLNRFACIAGGPSAAAELAWLLDLLVQTARYAEPAVDELDQSLLPGFARLRGSIQDRYATLWHDDLAGCPELLVVAYDAGCMEDDDPGRLFRALSTVSTRPLRRHSLLDAPPVERRAIRRRLRRLQNDIRPRRAFRDVLAAIWHAAEPRWAKFGREAARRSSSAWARRQRRIDEPEAMTALIPPRHPLVHVAGSAAELLRRRRRFTIVPVYFCLSGGQLADLDSDVHVGVPANPAQPIRRTRDALFVADRARVLAEPTRVRILIHLLSNPSGVMQMTRALGLAQPTVSDHVRVLARAGLVERRPRASGAVYAATWARAGRFVDDIKGSLARWV